MAEPFPPAESPAPLPAAASPLAHPHHGPPVRDPRDIARENRASLIRVVRLVFGALLAVVTLSFLLRIDTGVLGNNPGQKLLEQWWVPLTASGVLGLFVIALDVLAPVKKLATVSGIFFGLLVGLVASFALSNIIDLLAQSYGWNSKEFWPEYLSAVKILLGISLCYLGISTVIQTQDDFRLVIPYVEFARQIRGPRPMLLDSSALIDARIAELATTGIIQTPIIIPRFIVLELQTLADSSDKLKRAKGRRGLEIITRLQRSANIDVSIDDTQAPGVGADQMLLELARLMPATVVTTDTGLLRVASIQGISALNLHDVAAALRPALIPGTSLVLRIARAGDQRRQGVGYLDDGTMVVVEEAADDLDQSLRVEVTSTMQTAAGRLVFARRLDQPERRGSAIAQAAAAEPGGQPLLDAPDAEEPEQGPNEFNDPNDHDDGPRDDFKPDGPPPSRPGPFPPKRPVRSPGPRNPRRG